MHQTVAHRLTERRLGVLSRVERTGVLRIQRNSADPASVAHWAWPDGTHLQVGADLSWLARKHVIVPAGGNLYRVAEPYRDLVR